MAELQPRDGAHLLELANLINHSVQTILEQYSANSLSVPSLDSTDDAQPLVNEPVRAAARVLEGACAQLCASVTPAVSIMVDQACEMMTPACIRVALRGRIAEHLRDGPKTTAELARLSSIDAGKLVSKDVFANNRLSACLLPENTESALIGHLVDEVYHGFGSLADSLMDPEWTSSANKEKSPFAWAHGAPLFDFLENDPIRSTRFATAMQGATKLTGGPGTVIDTFPWDFLAPDSTFCDVGGGVGQVALALLNAKPHMRAVVQDQPSTIAHAEQFWNDQAADFVSRGRARLVPVDFFAGSPVEGCVVYYLKHILHDWPDADCVTILRNVRKAMTDPAAKVLIHEVVLDHGSSKAPSPLLPNYGAGALRAYNKDINMLSTLNARERTLDELVVLGYSAGLKFVTVWDCGETQIVELQAA
ncbi:S-adenosyl-L-methionine-dependent methyltransferase [Auricularia subglabra TFB-10046 SS5]|nr:S-adenosyl-L-methionine-dependent methyltransferase [Auricularia subglabra TFB-10046 SS5]